MRAVVFGSAVAALVGVIFGAGMRAPVAAGDMPRPELVQISFPVETTAQEDFRPEYIMAAAYAPTVNWDSDQPMLWQASYVAPAEDPVALTEDLAPQPAEDPPLDDEVTAAQHPYASAITTRSEAESKAERTTGPAARPASSWPNKRGDAKQQVFNGHDGFEHVVTEAAA